MELILSLKAKPCRYKLKELFEMRSDVQGLEIYCTDSFTLSFSSF